MECFESWRFERTVDVVYSQVICHQQLFTGIELHLFVVRSNLANALLAVYLLSCIGNISIFAVII